MKRERSNALDTSTKAIHFLDTHIHTSYCNHATGLAEEYVQQAIHAGLHGLIFTCHNPMPEDFPQGVRMQPSLLQYYIQLVEIQQKRYQHQSLILLGLECDWLPGFEDYLREQFAQYPFQFVIGSIHVQFPIYTRNHLHPDPIESQIHYFELLAQAAETGFFHTLAHPDLIKNLYPTCWNPEKLIPHIQPYLQRIAATGVAMELNTSGIYKSIPEFFPARPILQAMAQLNIPVTIGSDAHQPTRVSENFDEALNYLQQNGYDTVTVFDQQGQPIQEDIDTVRRVRKARVEAIQNQTDRYIPSGN